ncbi:MAG: DMT family transporter [Cyclobacteriaceae bacterium]
MKNLNYVLTGIAFALLWASASTAGKFGIQSVEPLTFFTIRFLAAGILLLLFSHAIMRYVLPSGKEWWQVTVFGAFNTALYLGIFIIALKNVAAGITTMAIALNPLLIGILSAQTMKRKVLWREWLSIFMGMLGVAVATLPLLKTKHATITGVLLIILCMLMYSIGSVYYASVKWKLQRTTINAWQVFIGGFMLLPFALFFESGNNSFDLKFLLSLTWLVIPVSIGAVQLWLRLLKDDAVRASIWLFLCPVFGLLFATILLDEPFTILTALGAVLVIVALYIGQMKKAA